MFKIGDRANILADGREIEVTVLSEQLGDNFVVEDREQVRTFEVNKTRLLRVKGPFFDVRGARLYHEGITS